MIHERHFTAAEANSLLPQIEPALRSLREARDRLTDAELHEALATAAPTNGGGDAGRVLRDIDRGLVDFPAIVDGREAYLCWQLDEEEVAFWHDLESGFGGRQPLD